MTRLYTLGLIERKHQLKICVQTIRFALYQPTNVGYELTGSSFLILGPRAPGSIYDTQLHDR